MKKHRPYIGVTGITCASDGARVIEHWRAAWGSREPSHDLMLGVLVSSKTLCNQPNKYPRRYPLVEEVARIFVHNEPGVVNLVHVCTDSEPSEVDGKRIPLFVDVVRGMAAGGPLCHGFQVNTARPSWEALAEVRAGMRREGLRGVLQARPRWLEARLDGYARPGGHMSTLLPFLGVDLLIDGSGGEGRPVKLDDALDLVGRTLRQLDGYGVRHDGAAGPSGAPSMRIGIAGGLCAETLPGLAPLFQRHPHLSIDAEGRLRDDADGGGNLDLAKVGAYLRAAVALVGSAS